MPYGYFQNYIPVLLFLALVVLLAGGLLLLSRLLGPRRPNRAKLAPYECGITPTSDARRPFNVRFHLVALVFIVFQIAFVFLYPWAVIFHELRMFGFIEMLLFLFLVLPGFVYLWKKGVLDCSGSEEDAGERR